MNGYRNNANLVELVSVIIDDGRAVSFSAPTWAHREVKLLPLIQPDFRNARRILQHDVRHATRKSVRRLVSENMTYMGAWRNFENTPALPDLNVEVFMKNPLCAP